MFNLKTDKNLKILIVGDLILDRYVEGNVDRISPEAPVPVLHKTHERDVLGGAANVANNINSLGAEAYLIGVLGNDVFADKFEKLAENSGINLRAIRDPNRYTTVKTRLLGDRQQLLRVDSETRFDVDQNIQEITLDVISKLIQQMSALIISDYRKGMLSPSLLIKVIKLAKSYGIPVFVDPKGNESKFYSGADYIKPNRSELEALTKMRCDNTEQVVAAAEYLSEKTDSHILVTLSKEGMILVGKNRTSYSLPTEAKEVFDVSGAGDTAIAAFVFALANGNSAESSMRLANIASGIAVSKIGTVAVSMQDIKAELDRRYNLKNSDNDKVIDIESAIKIRNIWRQQGFKVGFTNGCFDLIHPGHIALLSGASEVCDRLIVGLNSDASVARLKGPERPIQTEFGRAEVLRSIKYVDLVVIFREDTPLEMIKSIMPDVLIKGADYNLDDIVGADIVRSHGGDIITVPLRDGNSTTNLIKRSNSKND